MLHELAANPCLLCYLCNYTQNSISTYKGTKGRSCTSVPSDSPNIVNMTLHIIAKGKKY